MRTRSQTRIAGGQLRSLLDETTRDNQPVPVPVPGPVPGPRPRPRPQDRKLTMEELWALPRPPPQLDHFEQIMSMPHPEPLKLWYPAPVVLPNPGAIRNPSVMTTSFDPGNPSVRRSKRSLTVLRKSYVESKRAKKNEVKLWLGPIETTRKIVAPQRRTGRPGRQRQNEKKPSSTVGDEIRTSAPSAGPSSSKRRGPRNASGHQILSSKRHMKQHSASSSPQTRQRRSDENKFEGIDCLTGETRLFHNSPQQMTMGHVTRYEIPLTIPLNPSVSYLVTASAVSGRIRRRNLRNTVDNYGNYERWYLFPKHGNVLIKRSHYKLAAACETDKTITDFSRRLHFTPICREPVKTVIRNEFNEIRGINETIEIDNNIRVNQDNPYELLNNFVVEKARKLRPSRPQGYIEEEYKLPNIRKWPWSKRKFCVGRSTIVALGLFTLKPIRELRYVYEYFGDIHTESSVCGRDDGERKVLKHDDIYNLKLYDGPAAGASEDAIVNAATSESSSVAYVIDSKYSGNITRFFNHSNERNVKAVTIINCDRRHHCFSIAKRDIEEGEELTMNYKAPEDEKDGLRADEDTDEEEEIMHPGANTDDETEAVDNGADYHENQGGFDVN